MIVEAPTFDFGDDGSVFGGSAFVGGETGVGVTGNDDRAVACGVTDDGTGAEIGNDLVVEPGDEAGSDEGTETGSDAAPRIVFVGNVCGGVALGVGRLATDGTLTAGGYCAGRGGASVG